jgi:hypothetical protein
MDIPKKIYKDKTMSKKLLVKVNCYGTDDPDADCALVELRPEHLLGWRNRCRPILPDVYCVEIFDSTPQPFVDDITDPLVEGEYADVPDNLQFPDNFRMDTCILKIKASGVLWRFYEKHVEGVYYETAEIPWSEIE